MKNVRLRLQVMAIANLLFLSLFLVFMDYINPSQKSALRDNFGFQGLLVLTILIQVERLVARYYLNKIKFLFGKGLDDSTMLALQDASVFRLKRISKQAVHEIRGLNKQIDDLLLSAKPYPNLFSSQEFQKAVYGFKFEKARKMVALAERSAARLADEAKRKEHRGKCKMGKLIEEAATLGLLESDVKNMNPSQLREAILLEREWQSALATASIFGCRGVIEQIGKHDRAKLTLFLVQAQKLANEAKLYGVEVEVGKSISSGDLHAAEKLISAKRQEIEFFTTKKGLQSRIDAIPEKYRPPRQILFAVVCGHEFGSKAYYKALHDLEKSLSECGA